MNSFNVAKSTLTYQWAKSLILIEYANLDALDLFHYLLLNTLTE